MVKRKHMLISLSHNYPSLRVHLRALHTLLLLMAIGALIMPIAADPLYAQTSTEAAWTRFSQQESGLLANSVWSILAHDNEIWIGTNRGISRFDGKWTTFPAAEPASGSGAEAQEGDIAGRITLGSFAPSGTVQALASDAKGRVWAGTSEGRLAVWSGTGWSELSQSVDGTAVAKQLRAIHALHQMGNTLWIAAESGLWLLNGEELHQVANVGNAPIYALAVQADTLWAGGEMGLWQQQNERWLPVLLPADLPDTNVNALHIDSNNVLWIGTSVGAAWFDRIENQWTSVPVYSESGEPAAVYSLASDDGDSIWAATRFNGARQIGEYGAAAADYGLLGDPNLITEAVRTVAVDQDGSIWFGTRIGVFRFQERTWYSDSRGRGAEDLVNLIHDIEIDALGRYWIATSGGVRVKPNNELLLREVPPSSSAASLPAAAVYALAAVDDRRIWAGTANGLAVTNALALQMSTVDEGLGDPVVAWRTVVAGDDLPAPAVLDVMPRGKELWLATQKGVVQFDTRSNTIVQVHLPGVHIGALGIDAFDQVWAGGGDHIAIHRRSTNGQWESMLDDGVGNRESEGEFVSGFTPNPAAAGDMWIATNGRGLYSWSDGALQTVDVRGELPSNRLWSIATDHASGDLWVGSEAGVSRFDGRTWGTLRREDGLQAARVQAILPVENGYWFGGRFGLSRYRPGDMAPWIRICLPGQVERFNCQEANGGADGGADVAYDLAANERSFVTLEAGDLQTRSDKLHLFYRTVNEADQPLPNGTDINANSESLDGWNELARSTSTLALNFATPGNYRLEVQARDQDFNYSSVVNQRFEVGPAVTLWTIPLLGTLRLTHSEQQTFLFFGLLMSGTFGYVSWEILRNRRRVTHAVQSGFNPYISGEPVRREDMFFARHELLQRIIDTLHNNSIMIHGERRIGKTTLLYQLAYRLRNANDGVYWFLPVYIDLEGTTQDLLFHHIIEEIAHVAEELNDESNALAETLASLRFHEIEGHVYSDRHFNRDLRRLLEALQVHGTVHHSNKQMRVILLLDEMDVMSGFDHLVQQQLRRIFMRDFAATLGAVVAGIQISREWDRVESPWFNLFNEIAVQCFTDEEARNLLIEPVRGYYRYESDALDFILEQSGGRPFRLQQYGLESVSNMLSAGQRRIRLDHVQAAHWRIQESKNSSDAGLVPHVTPLNEISAEANVSAPAGELVQS